MGNGHTYSQLPVESHAPENEYGLRFIYDFLDLGASTVCEDLQGLTGYIHAAHHHRSGIDGAVFVCGSQYRRSPCMVSVLGRASEFFPYLLPNLLWSLKFFFHFSKERWLFKFTSLPRKAERYLAWSGVFQQTVSALRLVMPDIL